MSLPDPVIVWKGGMGALDYRIVVVALDTDHFCTYIERIDFDRMGNEAWRQATYTTFDDPQFLFCTALMDAHGIRPAWDTREKPRVEVVEQNEDRVVCHLLNRERRRDRRRERIRLVTVHKPSVAHKGGIYVGTSIELPGEDALGAPAWRYEYGESKSYDPTELLLQCLMPALGLKPDWDWRPTPMFETFKTNETKSSS